MTWIEALGWLLGLVVAVAAGTIVWFVGSIFRLRFILASQLGKGAFLAPANPLASIQLIQALKERPGQGVAHGARQFSPAVEMALEACLERNDGTPAKFTKAEMRAIPATAGRDVLGPPSVGPTLYFLGPNCRYQVSDIEAVRDILVRKSECFHKPQSMKRFLGRILGDSSLLLTDGDAHALQRRLVSSAFTFSLLQKMLPIMRRCAWSAVDLLDPDAVKSTGWLFDPKAVKSTVEPVPPPEPIPAVPAAFAGCPVVDASVAMSGLTLEIIAQSAFGGSFGAGAEASSGPVVPGRSVEALTVIEALEAGFKDLGIILRGNPLILLLPWIDLFLSRPEKTAFNEHKGRLQALTREVISKRRAKLADLTAKGTVAAEDEAAILSSDLLGLMIGSSVESKELSASESEAYRTGADAAHVPEGEATARLTGAAPADAARAAKSPEHRSSVTMLTDTELSDQCVTFVLAGHETTSQLLTWTLYCLSQAPEWQERLRDEARRTFSSSIKAKAADTAGGGSDEAVTPPEDQEEPGRAVPGLAAIKTGLPICSAVLQEVMRLYSPASLVARRTVKSVTISKGETAMNLPENAEVMIPIGAMHRKAELFVDPDDFDPARWLSDDQVAALGMRRSPAGLRPGDDPLTTARPELKGLSPFTYMPFSAGARNCVGQRFAHLEAHVCLSVLAAKMEWYLDPQYVHSPSMRITLQPMHGMPMRFRRAD